MPYTVRFFREGSIEVDCHWLDGNPTHSIAISHPVVSGGARSLFLVPRKWAIPCEESKDPRPWPVFFFWSSFLLFLIKSIPHSFYYAPHLSVMTKSLSVTCLLFFCQINLTAISTPTIPLPPRFRIRHGCECRSLTFRSLRWEIHGPVIINNNSPHHLSTLFLLMTAYSLPFTGQYTTTLPTTSCFFFWCVLFYLLK